MDAGASRGSLSVTPRCSCWFLRAASSQSLTSWFLYRHAEPEGCNTALRHPDHTHEMFILPSCLPVRSHNTTHTHSPTGDVVGSASRTNFVVLGDLLPQVPL